MKKILVIIMALMITTGCKAENGNSISKLETTIYKTNNHTEMVIEETFDVIKQEFMEKETFYHSSLLTIEYGVEDTEELESNIKDKLSAYEVIYLTFSFKTGDVSYEVMESNHLYNYKTYLIKYNENDPWHIYQMEENLELKN